MKNMTPDEISEALVRLESIGTLVRLGAWTYGKRWGVATLEWAGSSTFRVAGDGESFETPDFVLAIGALFLRD